MYVDVYIRMCKYVLTLSHGVSFAKEPCARDDILQKRPIT